MEFPYSVAIDFDGTVTEVDVIDEILRACAKPEWRAVEDLWERGIIGSRQCLEMQMAMIEAPLARILRMVDGFPIDPGFGKFIGVLRENRIPFAVVSDGFQVFIDRLLRKAGLKDIPVLANVLKEERGRLQMLFPYADPGCMSANCKCCAVSELSRDRALIVIGDGRSDFCLAGKAVHVYAKNSLIAYCREREIPYSRFDNFSDILDDLPTRGKRISPLPFAPGKD